MNALARAAATRPRRILLAVLLLALVAGAVGSTVDKHLEPYAPTAPPGSDSETARDRFVAAAGVDPEGGLIALIPAEGRPRSAETRVKVRRVSALLAADPAIAAVGPPPGAQPPAAISKDRRTLALVAAYEPDASGTDEQEAARRLIDRLEPLGVELGGSGVTWAQGNDTTVEDFRTAELLSFPLLVLLSLWFFRSGVAALVAAAFGGLAIVAGMFILRALSEVTFVSIFALNIITALGVGLAFDYCLLVINRYREELTRGDAPAQAIAATMQTAGRTVLLSALTIVAAFASMLVFPDRALKSMGIAGAAVTVAACVLALAVLPAALVLLGHRVYGLAPRRLRRAAERESRPLDEGLWYRLTHAVIRRPVLFAGAASAVLIFLALPALRLEITQGEATSVPKEQSAHRVADALREDFAPTYATSPIRVVLTGVDDRQAETYGGILDDLEGVAAVAPPRPLDAQTISIDVIAAAQPLSQEAQDVVERIRGQPAPGDVAVGGDSAILKDGKASLAERAPSAFAIALGTTLLALFVLTGSVVLPLKAVLLNLLSIAATLGLMVLIFQDGRLEGLLGYESQGGLILVIPPFVAALCFGLATDYGIFVLSRIKEQVDAGRGDPEAIAIGIERTGRVVTAAALLFSVAVGALATGRMLSAKEAGVGLAAAVLIDAMIVRTFLVPSLMVLLGRANWWAPAPLRRLSERFAERDAAAVRAPR